MKNNPKSTSVNTAPFEAIHTGNPTPQPSELGEIPTRTTQYPIITWPMITTTISLKYRPLPPPSGSNRNWSIRPFSLSVSAVADNSLLLSNSQLVEGTVIWENACVLLTHNSKQFPI